MSKAETIRKIYAILLSVFIAAMGIALICVASDIFYSGKGTGVIYSREIVGVRLKQLAIPLLFLLAAIIAGAIFPLYETKVSRTSEETLKKLVRRMPAGGDGEEFIAAQKRYKQLKMVKIAVWCFALAVALAGTIASLVYLLNTANFKGDDVTAQILRMVKNILPWTVASLVLFSAASVANGYLCKEQLKSLKTMIKCGSREIVLPKELELLDKVNNVASHDITLWAVRGAVLVVAVAFLIAGICNGGALDVLIKAINICQECIGLG